jgi:membrane protein involved in colicin uptake
MKITIIATGFAETDEERMAVKEHPAVTKANIEAQAAAEAAQKKDAEDLDVNDIMGLFRAGNGRGTTKR